MIGDLEAAMEKYKGKFPIGLNKSRSTSRRRKKVKRKAKRRKGKLWKTDKKRGCNFFMSLGETELYEVHKLKLRTLI